MSHSGRARRVARRKRALSPKFGFGDTPEQVSRAKSGIRRLSPQRSSSALDRERNRQRFLRRNISQGGPASRVSSSARRTIR